MDLNKEERLEQIREILISPQISDLEAKLQETVESETKLAERLGSLESFIKKEFTSLNKSFDSETQRQATTIKKFETNFVELETALAKFQNDDAYEHLSKNLQEYHQQWCKELIELEQKTLKHNQMLKEQFFSKFKGFREEVLAYEQQLKEQLLTQLKQLTSKLQKSQKEMSEHEEISRAQLQMQINYLENKTTIQYKKLHARLEAEVYSPTRFLANLFLWPWHLINSFKRQLHGKNNKEDTF